MYVDEIHEHLEGAGIAARTARRALAKLKKKGWLRASECGRKLFAPHVGPLL